MLTLSAGFFAGEEGQEGMRAFAEKRPPPWAPDESGAPARVAAGRPSARSSVGPTSAPAPRGRRRAPCAMASSGAPRASARRTSVRATATRSLELTFDARRGGPQASPALIEPTSPGSGRRGTHVRAARERPHRGQARRTQVRRWARATYGMCGRSVGGPSRPQSVGTAQAAMDCPGRACTPPTAWATGTSPAPANGSAPTAGSPHPITDRTDAPIARAHGARPGTAG